MSLLATRASFANGVFPNAGQIVVDPNDPAHIVVRTTYGVLTTRAGGEPWDWICESAVGYGNMFHPAVAVTADGTVLAGIPDGLSVAHGDTCGWTKASGPIDGAYVVDVSTERSDPSRAVAITASAGGGAKLWESLDDGQSWQQAGVDLPAGFTPLALDAAKSDPDRVYVSGLTGGGGTFKGSLAVSTDRGKSWGLFTVPKSDGERTPYVAGIDPANADRLYLRLDGSPGRLFRFDYATVTWTEVFTGAGFLYGFALSPDGSTLLVGGGSDGVWRAATADLAFAKVSEVPVRCLHWSTSGVYACATEFAAGFTVGKSLDEGASFEPVMHLPCVRGPLECDAGTPVGDACPADWPAVAILIDQATCAPGGSGGSGGAGGLGGSGGGAGAGGGGVAPSSGAGASPSAGTGGGEPAAGGGCALASSRGPGLEHALAWLGAAALAVRRLRGGAGRGRRKPEDTR